MYNGRHQGVFQCFFTVFIVIDLKRESYVNTVYNTIALYMLIVHICSNHDYWTKPVCYRYALWVII